MKTKKNRLLLALLACIVMAGYATLLVKSPPSATSFNPCLHMNVCPVLSGSPWP